MGGPETHTSSSRVSESGFGGWSASGASLTSGRPPHNEVRRESRRRRLPHEGHGHGTRLGGRSIRGASSSLAPPRSPVVSPFERKATRRASAGGVPEVPPSLLLRPRDEVRREVS